MTTDRTRTLVVTLDPGLIQQVRTALEEAGGAVSACPTGAGAQDEVGLRPYGLVVISAELADGDGFELTTQLKVVDPELSIMLVGDDRDGRSVERAHEAGAAGFLHRPVSTAELLGRFESVMGETWFRLPPQTHATPRHAESIVDPATGLFPAETGYDISVHEQDAVSAVNEVLSEDSDLSLASSAPSPTGTQELPALAMEMFDEHNPVSIPVEAHVTAHGMTPVRREDVVGALDTGSFGVRSTEAIVDERLDAMLADGGKLHGAIESAVERALADALAKQLPAFLAKLNGGDQ